MTARDALFNDIWDQRSAAEKNALIDAHRDEVALEIGRNALRDGLVPTLARLVGEANAAKMLADYRDVVAHELAEKLRVESAYWGSKSAAGRLYAKGADLIDPKATP